MRERWVFLVAVALAIQAVAVALVSGVEQVPAVPDLASFPTAIGDTYLDRRTGLYADLLVAWFQSQRGGARQPHSPKVCLPATGWTPQETGDLTLGFPSGSITVNRLLMAGNNQKVVVTYWYQTPRRVVAGEWAAKFWLAADVLRDRRSDTALVRIFVWTGKGGTTEAIDAAVRFTKSLYPLLRDHLPR
jgi:EpsI family protein